MVFSSMYCCIGLSRNLKERETEREEGGKQIVGLDATYRHTGVSIDPKHCTYIVGLYSVGTKEAERGEWYWEGRKLPTTI
jgi:hypothetical protein